MTIQFFGHPLSSYTQKALLALYELEIAFDWRPLSPQTPENSAELARLWPIEHMPVLTDGDRVLRESSIIIEYLDQRHAGDARLIPEDADLALEVRFLDRFFDNYVMTPMQQIVFDKVRPEGMHDDFGVAKMRERLDKAYAWLETALPEAEWAAGDSFTMADCSAAPALFYASKVQPFAGRFARIEAYLDRLERRPTNARIRDEARPFWRHFPFAD